MRLYVGQTRSRELVARLAALGIGECTNRGELPPRRQPFFLDNGAYADHQAGRSFDVNRWLRDLRWCAYRGLLPDFVALPDRVAGGLASLQLSLDWLPCVPAELAGRCYLVVQDGMAFDDVTPHCGQLAGVFVGGSTRWKLATGATWVDLAHRHGLACHIGRAGTPRRLAWAARIGADSVDSALPLRDAAHLARFLATADDLRRGAAPSGSQHRLALGL